MHFKKLAQCEKESGERDAGGKKREKKSKFPAPKGIGEEARSKAPVG